jgi:hypothetical protein
MDPVINRGTGAGGANTNVSGNSFEDKTSNELRLLADGYTKKLIPGKEKTKYGYYLEKVEGEKTIQFVTQNGLKCYMEHFHKKEICREVDEAYIITMSGSTNSVVKILEKKNQTSGGSVEDKLMLGHHFKFVEYPGSLGDGFTVDYAFCLAQFLKNLYLSNNQKWNIIRKDNEKNAIPVFFGDDPDYFSKLDQWINS